MLSYIAEPFKRIFKNRNEENNGRKRSNPSMNSADWDVEEGPSRKRPCSNYERATGKGKIRPKLLPDPTSSNCVQDWINKIRHLSMPLPLFNLTYIQTTEDLFLDDDDEEDDSDAESESKEKVLLNGDKSGISKNLTRDPLHQAARSSAITNGGTQTQVNGKWKETLNVSSQIKAVPSVSERSDGSVRCKRSFHVRRDPQSYESDDSPAAEPLLFKKYWSRRRPFHKTSTVLEPIRLDEKEQYRMLLEQCKVGSQAEPSTSQGTNSRHFPIASSSFQKARVNGDSLSLKKISDNSRKCLMDRLYLGSDFSGPFLTKRPVRKEEPVKPRRNKFLSLGGDFLSSSSGLAATDPQRNEVPSLNSSSRFNRSMFCDRLSFSELPEPLKETKVPGRKEASKDSQCTKRTSVSVLEKPLFSPEWLNDVQLSVDDAIRSRQKKQEKLEKRAREMREKREAKIFADNRKSLQRLSKTLNLKPSEDEEEEKLPEITAEMQLVIEDALRPTPPAEVLCEGFRLSIARRDMETLSGLNWLNDEIINFYMNLLMERGRNDNFPSVYAFNTFFYPKLLSGGHTALRRWTRQVDIFSYNYVLIPVHLGMHWCLAVIDFKQKKIQYYDSMGGQNSECINALKTYLKDEKRDKKKEEFDMADWKYEMVKNIPQQMNGSDCGMFTLKYAEYLTRNAKITFSQRHMPYFRRRMVYEIVTKALL